jgi:hypothetical protein
MGFTLTTQILTDNDITFEVEAPFSLSDKRICTPVPLEDQREVTMTLNLIMCKNQRQLQMTAVSLLLCPLGPCLQAYLSMCTDVCTDGHSAVL